MTPTVYIGGHGNMARYCPALQPRGPGDDGVWLQAGNPPPDARPVTVAGGTIVAEERGQPAARGERVVRLWYHRVLVEIGIGRHPKVARQILRSLGYMRGRPDSKVADVCPRSKRPVRMPAPQRLGRRVVVDFGNIAMTPPLHPDRPIMRAAQAWSESGPKSVFERYRLLLVRYHGLLAWVIYSSPFSTAVAGCGGWGLSGFNATTGAAMPEYGWSRWP